MGRRGRRSATTIAALTIKCLEKRVIVSPGMRSPVEKIAARKPLSARYCRIETSTTSRQEVGAAIPGRMTTLPVIQADANGASRKSAV
jgi:hypothetical protein